VVAGWTGAEEVILREVWVRNGSQGGFVHNCRSFEMKLANCKPIDDHNGWVVEAPSAEQEDQAARVDCQSDQRDAKSKPV